MEEACISTWKLYNIVNVHTMYIMCNTFQINLFLQRKATHEFSTKRLGVFEKRGQKYQKVCLTANIFMNVKSYNRIGASMHLYMKLYKYCKMYVQYTLIIIWLIVIWKIKSSNQPKCYHEWKKFKTELEEVCICTWNCTIL